jgi:hypothetical protein
MIPTDASARKSIPLFSGLVKYFPQALTEVAILSRIGNEQHNPGSPLHWDRAKSGDELDALTRHLFEAGKFDIDGVRHSVKLAWRALANLEKELESHAESLPICRAMTMDEIEAIRQRARKSVRPDTEECSAEIPDFLKFLSDTVQGR